MIIALAKLTVFLAIVWFGPIVIWRRNFELISSSLELRCELLIIMLLLYILLVEDGLATIIKWIKFFI